MPQQRTPSDYIYVALDTAEAAKARALVDTLRGKVGGFKVGMEFYTALGAQGVRDVIGDEPVFFDLKLHDIPNTVAGAVRALVGLKPKILNVHVSGGTAMMQAAVKAAKQAAKSHRVPVPSVIGVTVLTSLDEGDLGAIGQSIPVAKQVVRLATLAKDAGLDGVVCSPREISLVRGACGADFKLVTPGIRPSWAVRGDQKRVMTPRDAVTAGADVIVIGRPITGADDPVSAAERIAEEIEGVTV